MVGKQRSGLMAEELRRELQEVNTVGRDLLCLEETGSTNDYARELACCGGADGTVVIADRQTAGRGRMGRSFQSAPGKGLYLTVLLRPVLPAERLLPVTALAGVAVCDAVEQVCGVRPGLKWPNDPVLHGKKLGGILTELCVDEDTGEVCLILGIGINVHQTEEDFSPEVARMAASLSQLLGRNVQRLPLAVALIRELDALYSVLQAGELSEYLAVYRQDCVNLGKTVQLIRADGKETAQAIDVDEQFGLVVRMADGSEKIVRSGEVSVRGMYGYAE